MWPQPLEVGASSQMLVVTVTQERLSLWLLEVGLSPGPGAMRLESDEQGHCLTTGARHQAAPQELRWGGLDASPGEGANLQLHWAALMLINYFLMKLLFCPSVSPCWAKQFKPTVYPRDAHGFLAPWF